MPERSADTAASRALKTASKKEVQNGGRMLSVAVGDVIKVGRGVYLLTLFPARSAVPAGKNDSSYVFKLIHGDSSMLLAGDIPAEIERYLAARYGRLLDSDILKVAHHGSDTSSSRPFVSAVSPQYAVISAGDNNRYGHPHQGVLDRLEAVNASTTCTCEGGTITFESDGKEFTRIK
jgi:competence protein ComEC